MHSTDLEVYFIKFYQKPYQFELTRFDMNMAYSQKGEDRNKGRKEGRMSASLMFAYYFFIFYFFRKHRK